jgi:formylglycine-generating enzyme required for sulfatase activity
MAGNVYQWVQDCHHDDYDGAPTDGSAWTTDDCENRVVRGGCWNGNPGSLRAALRGRGTPDGRSSVLGFRIGRTLTP